MPSPPTSTNGTPLPVRITSNLIADTPPEKRPHAVVRVDVETPDGWFSALGEASAEDSTPDEFVERAEDRALARALSLRERGLLATGNLPTSAPVPPLSGPSSSSNGHPSSRSREDEMSGSGPTLTSAQRRFLYRLVVEQGVDPKDANNVLSSLGKVRKLADLSRKAASNLIDALQNGEVSVAELDVARKEAR